MPRGITSLRVETLEAPCMSANLALLKIEALTGAVNLDHFNQLYYKLEKDIEEAGA